VLQDIGGFGGLFQLNQGKYRNPVLVSGTDGAGTKLKLAFETGFHRTPGVDCVAMCVNDLLVQGAEPLFFLDYLALGEMDNFLVKEIVEGIAEGCQKSGCALLGGETAEMPGFYSPGEYELAGFSVGIVEKDQLIDGSGIQKGDGIIGMASSGVHSNGFSLVRKILQHQNISLGHHPHELEVNLGEELLKPTRIYVPSVLPLLSKFRINGMAHITGGGIPGNVRRILPPGSKAVIDSTIWETPRVFHYLQKEGGIETDEMFNVFNMGIGFIMVAPPGEINGLKKYLDSMSVSNWLIGEIKEGDKESPPEVDIQK